jgi:hypothetical protein
MVVASAARKLALINFVILEFPFARGAMPVVLVICWTQSSRKRRPREVRDRSLTADPSEY